MSITVLQPGAVSITPIGPEVAIEPGALLVLDSRGDPILDHLGALIDAWRPNSWSAAALFSSRPVRRTMITPLLPPGMRVEIATDDGDLVALARAVVARAIPAKEACCNYFAARLGPAIATTVSHAVDPDFAGSGPLRALHRAGFPPPVYWKRLIDTAQCVATSIADAVSEAGAADRFGVSVKTLSRRCGQLFGLSWRELRSLGVWEAIVETGLRHRGLVGVASATSAPHLGTSDARAPLSAIAGHFLTRLVDRWDVALLVGSGNWRCNRVWPAVPNAQFNCTEVSADEMDLGSSRVARGTGGCRLQRKCPTR